MKKSTYIGIFIIILLMVLVLSIFAFTGNSKKTNSTINKNVVGNQEVKQNEQMNEQTNEVVSNETVNNEVENFIQDEGIQNIEENIISTETFEESPKTAEEKALELVKKDWGADEQVEFLVEGIDESGNYIVAIRNSQTTEAKAFYSVDTNNGTFTKREMN